MSVKILLFNVTNGSIMYEKNGERQDSFRASKCNDPRLLAEEFCNFLLVEERMKPREFVKCFNCKTDVEVVTHKIDRDSILCESCHQRQKFDRIRAG